MRRKRRSFGASWKAKAALAAVRGDRTMAQLATKFGVHANQISNWKRQLLEGAAELFQDRRGKRNRGQIADEQELYEQISIAISMDGRGRAIDNVFIERLWRSVKYEEVYLKDCADG